MPGLIALVVALALYFLFFRQRKWLASMRVRRAARRWGGAAMLAVALLAALTGRFVPAAALVLVAFGLIGFTAGARLGQTRASNARADTPSAMDRAQALAVLGLAEGAGPAEIQEAYRRLIVKVHPDHGGSADLASRLNAARDTLLAGTGR